MGAACTRKPSEITLAAGFVPFYEICPMRIMPTVRRLKARNSRGTRIRAKPDGCELKHHQCCRGNDCQPLRVEFLRQVGADRNPTTGVGCRVGWQEIFFPLGIPCSKSGLDYLHPHPRERNSFLGVEAPNAISTGQPRSGSPGLCPRGALRFLDDRSIGLHHDEQCSSI